MKGICTAIIVLVAALGVPTQAQPMAWRGLLLDSGREYQTVDYIHSLLDSMAVRGMNRFHWHLTENEAWRMQLACAPRLTPDSVQSYSRQQITEIIRYAAERGIVVVPEVDLPGHSGALIKAYPELGCSEQVVCPANDTIVAFFKRVLDEVCHIFPSPYIHLGGDEVNHAAWRNCAACQELKRREGIESEAALQVWFESQLVNHLATLGRTAILWEDVLYETDAPLPTNLVIQWWNYRTHGERGLREALKRGIPVISSSNYYCYLNFPESPWRGYAADRTFTAKDIEERNPSYLTYDSANHLMLGMEACLWTDYQLTQPMLNDRLYPRLDILARQMRRGDPLPSSSLKGGE